MNKYTSKDKKEAVFNSDADQITDKDGMVWTKDESRIIVAVPTKLPPPPVAQKPLPASVPLPPKAIIPKKS